jgi:hypothetical protein
MLRYHDRDDGMQEIWAYHAAVCKTLDRARFSQLRRRIGRSYREALPLPSSTPIHAVIIPQVRLGRIGVTLTFF